MNDELPDPIAPDQADAVLPDELPPPSGDEIRPDSFIVTTGFLRAGGQPIRVPIAPDGASYDEAEADEAAREFFDALVGDRDVEHEHADPVEFVRSNGLMLLFSEGVAELFETHVAAMPASHQERWRDLIAGGARSEAFGPLTLEERLDERQVETALVAGRRQRLINIAVSVVGLLVIVGGGWWAYQTFGIGAERERGALQFESTDEPASTAALEGGPPVADPLLTTTLNETVAVLAGTGPIDDRVTTAPFAAFPYPPGALAISVFQYAGSGHVALVGPTGFADTACLRVSVVTSGLRPLDTVTHGPCADPVGRSPAVGCVGPSAVLLALDIPAGEVDLPEGGTGFADAIRAQMIVDNAADYEVLTQRATIAVDPESDVVIPRFGGAVGEQLTFDLGAGHVGSCTLTDDLPREN